MKLGTVSKETKLKLVLETVNNALWDNELQRNKFFAEEVEPEIQEMLPPFVTVYQMDADPVKKTSGLGYSSPNYGAYKEYMGLIENILKGGDWLSGASICEGITEILSRRGAKISRNAWNNAVNTLIKEGVVEHNYKQRSARQYRLKSA